MSVAGGKRGFRAPPRRNAPRTRAANASDDWRTSKAPTPGSPSVPGPMGLLTRKGQLAAEGALSLFMKWSRHTLDVLVDAGRDWEEEFGRPRGRRRVQMDDDAD